MDISECADKLNAILKELLEYRVIHSYGIHFLDDVLDDFEAIKIVFDYGKNQRYAFIIYKDDIDKDPLVIYDAIEHHVLSAYRALLSLLVKEKLHLEKEEPYVQINNM